ncbi:metallophosphoesterase [Haloferula rosea]|uniref:Calcineurin-like phosphoesterase domain-containing protein n=1 Tax=Haloferula rosea TaxID=490093 RepID=A0A934RHD7_9BACT|nr:metallophosphoesterase [Haloferula rosea]MBK1828360.1 hypothetical protein [Haloferula rosea]
MKEPVLILSDLHLGHSASRIDRVECLRPLIAGAATVVFNGDTWQELASAFRQESERLLGDLRALCEELGAEPVFLSGNHDPGWPGKGWLELAGGRIVVTHGDAVMWAGSPWSREAFQRQEQLLALWAEHRLREDDAGERLRWARKVAVTLKAARHPKGRSLMRRVWDAVNPPRRALEILHAWWKHAELSDAFAARYFPRAEVVVTGHFHGRGVWDFGRRLVLNTGAHVAPHEAMWVEWSEGWLRCGEVERGESYRRGRVLGVWRLGSRGLGKGRG